jgi:hypothetical protein
VRRPAWSWARVAVTAALFVTVAAAAAPARGKVPPTGDALLRRAVGAPGLHSYAVPVHFAVHLHKPLGLRTKVEGTAYFEAPAQSALQITKASGIVGGFFKGAYKLDLVPQAWPVTYHVLAVTPAVSDGSRVLELRAETRAPSTDLAQVVFTLTTPALQPIAVVWQYQNGSSIRLSYGYGRVGPYTLPQRAMIAVDMPRYRLDADATYDGYALNAPVPESVFSGAK